MAVSTTTSSINYTGTNTANQVCPVPFYFFANADLVVSLLTSAGVATTLTIVTNYSVTGAGTSSGGSVTILAAVPATTTITIARTLAATQLTSFLTGDRFPASSNENALDRVTMLVQQVIRGLNRSVRLADSAPDSTPIIPLPNQFFGTNSSGAIALVAGTNAPAGSITNASIATNAAIEGTKISPNFGTQNLVTTGTITSPSFLGNATTATTATTATGIADGAVSTTAKIANGVVTASKLGTTEQKQLCKAWVNFNGTVATPSTIRSSYNVSSVTKVGTGNYAINFATAMVDANYSVSANTGNAITPPAAQVGYCYQPSNTTSLCNVIVSDNNTDLLQDPIMVCVQIFGN